MPGIHDFYKSAFSEHSKPTAEGAMLGMQGLGHEGAMGKRYQLDPAAYRSVSTMGTIGFLQDAATSETAKFSFGGLALPNFIVFLP